MIIACESCYSTFELKSSLVRSTGTKVRCSKCQKVFRVYPPQPSDPRKSKRVKTRNLISYYSFDKTGKLTSEGLGIVLNISEGGILLETPYPIQSRLLLLTATDEKKNLIEIKGKLISSRKSSMGTFLSGIEFVGVDERMEQFVSNLITEYNFHRKNLYIAIRQKTDNLNPRSITCKQL